MGEARGKPGSGVRARVAVPPPVEVRVAEIRALMERGEWRSATVGELAERWGLSRSRVLEHSAEASRQLRSVSREEAAAKVAALLEKAEQASAYSKTRAADLVKVALAWMKLHGLERGAATATTTESNGSREAWFEEEEHGER